MTTAYATADKKSQPFCGKDSVRYKLNKPFWVDGHVYATDGRAIVRYLHPCPQPAGGVEMSAPRIAEMPWRADGSTRWPTSRELRGAHEFVMVGNRKVAIKYARKIARLGVVYYSEIGECNDALTFTTKTLQGIVMPLNQ